uniref:hypothetical protein n=1 Tax=Sphingobacterium cavernae TaxID=2592657 RepID=UPI00122FCA79|nr:hypothetical protein [Sphingobacterium cavernae]
MSIKESDFDFESMKDLALEQLRSGESLYGKNGAFAPLMKKFLEAVSYYPTTGQLHKCLN